MATTHKDNEKEKTNSTFTNSKHKVHCEKKREWFALFYLFPAKVVFKRLLIVFRMSSFVFFHFVIIFLKCQTHQWQVDFEYECFNIKNSAII